MWQPGPFAGPVGSFVGSVPVPGVDPLSGDCSIIRLNNAWLPYIRGALSQLWLQSTWDTDADGLALVTQQVTNLIAAFNQLEPGPCGTQPIAVAIAESDYEMSLCEQLRFQDGKLQALCCGEWTDIQGQASQGNVVPSQPGSGAPIPSPNGGTAKYCGSVGDGEWLLPVQVSAGDTLLFSDLGGAWKDSADLLVWECPNGWNYALGNCWERGAGGGSDPLPSLPHLQLIAIIGGTPYDCLQSDANGNPTLFTVPGGILNAQVTIQGNIDNIARIQGDVAFCVTVTNNQLGAWSHTFDFPASNLGWSVRDEGSYSPGIGFVDGTVVYTGNIFRGTDIQRLAVPARTITRVRWICDYAAGSGGLSVFGFSHTAPGAYAYTGTPTPGVFEYDTGPVSYASVTDFYIDMICGDLLGVDPGGHAIITQVIIDGIGADPF